MSRKNKENESHPVFHKYFHPLRLQELPPDRFTRVVNNILSGKFRILVSRLVDKGKIG
jgi:hypothetical protein